ncbi:MAG: methyltransferase domain-containing protein [Candidatus Aminicenantaceae bacterium]
MKPALLQFLKCIHCGSALTIEIFDQQSVNLRDEEKELILQTNRNIYEYETEILNGILVCSECGTVFPVSNGVPRIYKDAEKDFPLDRHYRLSAGEIIKDQEERNIQEGERKIKRSFSSEWDEFSYDDETIWLWTIDKRIDTFYEEIGISSPDEIKGKLMIDAGCGSGVLAENLSRRNLVEVIAFDISSVVERAFQENKSNLCHFMQASVLDIPLRDSISDVTYSHGVLHHTPSTQKAFNAIAGLAKHKGLLYVWLYGKKRGWNRFRFIFFRTARTIISRLPKLPQTFMVYVMALIHLTVRFVKRHLGMEKVNYKTMSQFLVGIRDKYTHIYAREHTEDEVKNWFRETGYTCISRRTTWEKTKMWNGSTDLSIRGIRL